MTSALSSGFGGLIGAAALLGVVGAGVGWLMDFVVGPPHTAGQALWHGAAVGVVLAIGLYFMLRSGKGVEMAIAAVVMGVLVGLVSRFILRDWRPAGWLYGLAVWGGGFGGFMTLVVAVGLLATARRSRP